MSDIVIIRRYEACETDPHLPWDSVWIQDSDNAQGGYADWALAEPDETGNQIGLRAKSALHTAILICLFTDKRLPDGGEPTPNDPDRRGWHGDTYDVRADKSEREMGSLLWTLERGALTEFQTEELAKSYCHEALQTLIDQGVVASFKVETEADVVGGLLKILVNAYSNDGSEQYSQRFGYAWEQTRN
ncbi:MAG: phage GP46 family protein [Hyphomicrobiales bacterium]